MATTRQVRSVLIGLRQQGFAQRDIAGLTGLSRSFVSDLLGGRRRIGSERATEVVERFAQPGYLRSVEVVDHMRGGLSLRDAARKVHTTPATVLKHVGPVLRKGPKGEWRARASDRLPRIMRALTQEGEVHVLVTDSKQASLLGQYSSALRGWSRGDRPDLSPFKAQTLTTVDGRRIHLLTDETKLRRLADAGELRDIDDVYA